jgi:ketosteroid isomerase-like protein
MRAVATAKGRAVATAKGRAAEVVREFYEGVNRRDLAAVAPLIAEGCVYEDLVFPRPMVGRDSVVGFFGEFMGSVSPDLRFVIDDISGEDPFAVGVTWHLGTPKLNPHPFAFRLPAWRRFSVSDG